MSSSTRAERLIEIGATSLLVFTPLAFGAVEPWSEAIVEIIVLAMVATYVIANLRNWELRVDLPPGWLPGLLFLALVGLQSVVSSWSLDAHATRREALKLGACAAFFVIGYNTFRTPRQVRRLIWTVVAVGAAIAVFGVVQRMTWTGRLYWLGPEAPRSAQYTFGPFVNRAHYAGLAAIILPAAVVLVTTPGRRDRRRPPDRGWRAGLRRWNSRDSSARSLAPFLMVVIGAAALVAGSRGGVGAVIAGLVATLVAAPTGRVSGRRQIARVALVGILIVVAAAWIGGDVLYGSVERLVSEVEQGEGRYRWRVWTDALAVWAGSPLLGTGLATFGLAFAPLRSLQADFVVSHAESDWVGLLVESGAVGLTLALWAVVTLGRVLLRSARAESDRSTWVLATAAFGALASAVVQGIANHNLPVMSNLIYLAAVLAVAHPVDAESAR